MSTITHGSALDPSPPAARAHGTAPLEGEESRNPLATEWNFNMAAAAAAADTDAVLAAARAALDDDALDPRLGGTSAGERRQAQADADKERAGVLRANETTTRARSSGESTTGHTAASRSAVTQGPATASTSAGPGGATPAERPAAAGGASAAGASVNTQTRKEPKDTDWHRKNADELKKIGDEIEDKIRDFSIKHGVEGEAVRRALHLHRPVPRKLTLWNKFEMYAKAHPGWVKEWETANPDKTSAADHYKHLSEADKKMVADWKKERYVVGTVKDMKEGLNSAQKTVTKLLKDITEDYGILGFAVLTHPDPEIVPETVGGDESLAALDSAVKRINPGFNRDRLVSVWDGIVSGEPPSSFLRLLGEVLARREKRLLDGEPVEQAEPKRPRTSDPAEGTTTHALGPGKAAAAMQLRVYLQPLISALAGAATASSWAEKMQRKRGPVIYAGFFDTLRSLGLQVTGWPQATLQSAKQQYK
ncbi:hypothetical protein V8E36_009141 [Tilletia maclaganii]